MVHVEIVMSRIVGVQNHLLAPLRSCVEQHVDTERKVIEKEVAALRLHTPMRTRRVNLHFVLALEEHPIGRAQIADHVLHRVAEQHLAHHRLFARLQHAHAALRVDVEPEAASGAFRAENRGRLQVELLIVAGQRQHGRS